MCVERDGKILLHKRKGGHSHGSWAFPGGHLEFGESFVDGALRELAEEAGPIQTTMPEFWTVANSVFGDRKHYVVIFMRAEWVSGEAQVMEKSKCQCWEWFRLSELPSPLMAGIQELVDKGEMNYY